jgi:hypothetical protein
MAYLQCKISSSLVSKHCDCEKIWSADDSPGSHDEPLSNPVKAHVPDELFFFNHLSADFVLFSSFAKKPTAFNSLPIPECFAGKLFQPPRI